MTPEQAVALACDALGSDPTMARVLRAGDAITVLIDEQRVARVIPGDAAAIAASQRVLAAARAWSQILQPLGEAIVVSGALVVPYPRIEPGIPADTDLGIGGACLAGFHREGQHLLERDEVDLPGFDPTGLATSWLERADTVFTMAEAASLLDAIAKYWPDVAGPTAVLHGDAHRANWWPSDSAWWVLIDSEFLSIGPAIYDLAPFEVTERRLGLGPSRFPSFLSGYESTMGRVDPAALTAAIRVRELLSVAWLAARAGEDSEIALRARHRLEDALLGRDGSWLA